MSNKPTIRNKYPIKDVLSMMAEGIIDDFVWYVPDQKEAVYFRSCITKYVMDYEGLKLKTNIVKGIVGEEVTRFVFIQRAETAEDTEE